MIPDGIDGIAWMQQLAGHLDHLQTRAEIEGALEAVEHLIEAADPELQVPAYQLVEALQARLAQASG